MLQKPSNFRIDWTTLPPKEVLFGSTSAMLDVMNTIERVSDTDLSILIRGETGTGKELVARYVHARSHLRDAAFVKLNCAAIPLHLLESELMGYEKGAFTGAHKSKPGLIELADGGTLFLDEIGDMDAALQAKLLHLLQDGRYARVGAQEERRAQVRIICATNSDLEEALEKGTFRSDLFYRIEMITLHLLPLRDRREDIPTLCDYFRQKLAKKFSCNPDPLSPTTLQLVSQWPWPGNIRELESWVMREMVLGPDEAFNSELRRQCAATGSNNSGSRLEGNLKEVSRESARAAERILIMKQLEANQWNRRKTAKALEISYRSLLYKLRDAGVPSRRSNLQVISGQNGQKRTEIS